MEQKPRILPLVWMLLAMLAMAALHWSGPYGTYLSPPWNWLGLAPCALGLWIAGTAARAFQRVETGLIPFDEATVLVTDGLFRFTRNPMYLGMVVFLAGMSMIFGCLGTLMPVVLFAVVIHYGYILKEERFMVKAFGDRYLAYRGKVRRWL